MGIVSRGSGSALQVLLAFAVGRAGGADDAGILFLFVAWVRIAEAAMSLGIPLYTLRGVAAARARAGVENAVAVVISSSIAVVTGAAIALSAVAFLSVADVRIEPEKLSGLTVHIVTAGLALGLIRTLAEALKGEQKPVVALLAEYSVPPFVVTVYCAMRMLTGNGISAAGLISAYEAGLALALIVLLVSWARLVRHELASLRTDEVRVAWRNTTASSVSIFWAYSLASLAYAALPTVLVSAFGTASDIGQFGMAQRLVGVAAIVMAGLGSTAMPAFARAFAGGDWPSLRTHLRRSQVAAITLGGPPMLVLLFAAEPVLSFFGEGFADGDRFLIILAVGQIANLSCGLAGEFLNMTGGQKMELRNILIGVSLLLLLSATGGYVWGAISVAIAYSVSLGIAKSASLASARRIIARVLAGTPVAARA